MCWGRPGGEADPPPRPGGGGLGDFTGTHHQHGRNPYSQHPQGSGIPAQSRGGGGGGLEKCQKWMAWLSDARPSFL